MKVIHKKSDSLQPIANTFCPGCLHGVAHSLIAESLDELQLAEKTVAVLPVGCSTLGVFYWDLDATTAAHGRAPAVATGIKRVSPESIVFTYQGDGDLAAIGLSEIMHAANRGENITTFFINNNIYGMTGGQMAPTTLIGQKSTTSPYGRDANEHGLPMNMSEIISTLKAPVFVARFSLDTPKNIIQAKKGIKKALQIQAEGKGYTFIELMANCPTNWGITAVESLEYMQKNTLTEFPIGVYKDEFEEVK